MKSLLRDFSLSAVVAGLLAVIISYAGPLAIFYQAAQAGHMSDAMFASWVWGISVGAAVSGIVLSAWLKVPVITAWSAPGTALLLTLFPGLALGEAVGAYLTAAALLLLIGVTGIFDALVARIPRGVASGMMAGILLQFGLNAFNAIGTMPLLAGGMLAAYLLLRRLLPRYCIVLLLAAGYRQPVRPLMAVASLASLATACTGGITTAVAAITAALCTGPDAHQDPARRYIAGIASGLFFLVGGLCAGSLVLLFAALPKALIASLAGLALLGAITSSLAGVVGAEDHREAAVIAFLSTASGMRFMGMGAAFWGIVIGMLAYWVLRAPKKMAGATAPAPDQRPSEPAATPARWRCPGPRRCTWCTGHSARPCGAAGTGRWSPGAPRSCPAGVPGRSRPHTGRR